MGFNPNISTGGIRTAEGGQSEPPPRMACALCRRRKLRCDRQLPCDSCVRLGFECSYEALKPTQLPRKQQTEKPERRAGSSRSSSTTETRPRAVAKKTLQHAASSTEWSPEQMTQEDMAELERTFFATMHLSVPILHESRYCIGTISEPRLRPPNFLRYIVCALGASISDRYKNLHDALYRSARHLLEEAEFHEGSPQSSALARAQAWIFIALYELMQMQFNRWWMSTARAVRLCQYLGLHLLDSTHPVKRHGPVAKDWVELEEQRRAFWMSFCIDRYAAFGQGCPMIIDEKDIHCLLPTSDEAYQRGVEEPAITLHQALTIQDKGILNPSAVAIVLTSETGMRLRLLGQSSFSPSSSQHDIWQKVNWLDETLHFAFSVPPHLAASGYSHTPFLTFLHMCAPTSTIRLHEVAEEQASAQGITPSSLLESQALRLAAAEMIAGTMRLSSHLDVRIMHPFTGVCLFTAARVFMRCLTVRPDESQQRNLMVLLEALKQLQAMTPWTGGYFKELDAEFPGMRIALFEQYAAPTAPTTRSPTGDERTGTQSPDMSGSTHGSGFGSPHLAMANDYPSESARSFEMQYRDSPDDLIPSVFGTPNSGFQMLGQVPVSFVHGFAPHVAKLSGEFGGKLSGALALDEYGAWNSGFRAHSASSVTSAPGGHSEPGSWTSAPPDLGLWKQ